jgi:hypothetical protein
MSVEVLCLKDADDDLEHESFNRVDITRLHLKRHRGGKLGYLIRYGTVILIFGAILARRSAKRRYDLVHIHIMPDLLILSALVPKLLGAKTILDLHDPMPELMQAIFGLRENSFLVWILKQFEKLSIRLANLVITPNAASQGVFLSRSASSPRKLLESSTISGPRSCCFFDLGDADDLAVRIEYAFRHPEEVIEIVDRGQKIYQRHKWSKERLRLSGLANRLLTRRKVATPETQL